MACITGYLLYICKETHYEKCLRKVAKFVSEQNDRVYKPRGLLLTDPTTRGLRLIEISVLDRPASWLHISRSREFFMWPAHYSSDYLARITDMHALVNACRHSYVAYRLVWASRGPGAKRGCLRESPAAIHGVDSSRVWGKNSLILRQWFSQLFGLTECVRNELEFFRSKEELLCLVS